jgi:hypothetical protein
MNRAQGNSPFLRNNSVEESASSLIKAGNLEEAFQMIAAAAQTAAHCDEYLARQIYMPRLDDMISHVSTALIGVSGQETAAVKRLPVIVATELYADGGHSRIVEDLVSMLDGAIVILTNFFPAQASRSVRAQRAIGRMPIVCLPTDTACENTLRLHDFCARLASHVYLLTHHHDVVALAATATGLTCPVYFIHHSDHRPSLGNTIDRFTHVDLVPHMHRFCSDHLRGPVHYWPMGLRDRGAKQFQYPLVSPSSASAASWQKFAWQGELAYPLIISDLLRSGVDRHYHFGFLPDEKLKAVHSELANHGLAADRFEYVGMVKSIWDQLLGLPIHVFVGSAPLHGLRTSMEVQGAGIPFCPYRQEAHSLMDETGTYDPTTPSWVNRSELVWCITQALKHHGVAAARSRRHYEQFFRLSGMKAAIEESHRCAQADVAHAHPNE